MTSRQSINILGLGLDARFRGMLRVFFDRRRDTRYKFVNHNADIVIADMDVWGVRKSLADYREEHNAKPAILFSLNEVEYRTGGDFVVLRKPFTVKQLVSAFDIVDLRFRVGRQRLTHLSTTSKRHSDQPDPAEISEMLSKIKQHVEDPGKSQQVQVEDHQALQQEQPQQPTADEPHDAHRFQAAESLSGRGGGYVKLNALLSRALDEETDSEESTEYDPEAYLQGALTSARRKARRKHKNIRIEFGSGSIIIDTKLDLVEMGMGGFQLRELASFPLVSDKARVLVLSRRQARIDTESTKTMTSFESLLWKASLFASRGRAPVGTDLNAPVRLRRWPNFTRILLSPGALRIAALWVEQPLSITQLQKMLKLSEQDVLGFYSAALATGLIQSGKDSGIEPVKEASRTGVRGLLRNILKKLHT